MTTNEISGSYAAGITLTSDAFDNPVTVTSTATVSGGTEGAIAAQTPWTIDNAGQVSGTSAGVYLYAGGSVTNTAIGDISGGDFGIEISRAAGTIENAGTIGGGTDAVYFGAAAANRLIVDADAVFDGNVAANSGGTNTIELTSGATAGTLSGLGTEYKGFQTVTIDSGASWTVAGTVGGFSTATIQGFTAADRLELTDVTFVSGDTVSLDGGTDILTIKDAGGAVLDTVQLTGSFANEFFHLADDGNHGTYVTEDEAPCYCRGTHILTTEGEVAVENLKIGDRLVTKSGEARPIRWIGMRAFGGRFIENNRNLLPVLIRADALADNVPKRDLWVSPLHTMYLDDVLIPAFALVNGTSIFQAESVDRVEYFHLELESHDVIVAEGALSESFIDDDSRNTFYNASEYRRLYPDAIRKPAEYCAPIVEDGELLENIRHRIAARVEDERMRWAA